MQKEMKPQPAAILAVETTGPNTWAITRDERDDDGLTTYTLLAGPGITGVIGPR
jgi:hypothetical protein